MKNFSTSQKRDAICLICPFYLGHLKPCGHQHCNSEYKDHLLSIPELYDEAITICHWLYDEELSYFGIKE